MEGNFQTKYYEEPLVSIFKVGHFRCFNMMRVSFYDIKLENVD